MFRQVECKQFDKPYSSMIHNKKLVDLYASNLASIQPENVPSSCGGTLGSTDMGNVSHVVPSIHPTFYMGGTEVNHTSGFTKEAGTVIVVHHQYYHATGEGLTWRIVTKKSLDLFQRATYTCIYC